MICRGSSMTSSGRFRGRRRDGSSRRAIQNGSDDCPPGMASARSFASGSRAAGTTRTCGSNGRYARSSTTSTPTRFAEGLWTPPPSGCGPVHATGQAWTEFSWKWTRSRPEQHTAGQDRPWHTLVLPLAVRSAFRVPHSAFEQVLPERRFPRAVRHVCTVATRRKPVVRRAPTSSM